MIFPWPDEERNDKLKHFIKKANEIWDEFTTGKSKRVSMEDKRKDNHTTNTTSLKRDQTSKHNLPTKKDAGPSLSNAGSVNNLRSLAAKTQKDGTTRSAISS